MNEVWKAGATMMRGLFWLGLLSVIGTGCEKKGTWLVGRWLLLEQDGKPGVCHEFRADGRLTVYTSTDCDGDQDQVSSGRWEMKDESGFGIIRFNERKGQLAMIGEKDTEHFVCRGAIVGTMFKIGAKGSAELLAALDSQGLIKVKPLDPALGCRQVTLPLQEIRSLPSAAVEDVRMLRHKDQVLKFHVNRISADPRIDKAVYALNDESLEWVALHLTQAAFNPPGPRAALEASAGKPSDEVAIGVGEKRQHIVMWKSYCSLGRNNPKHDIDITLFATAGTRRGTIYVSDNVVSGLWDELKQAAQQAGTDIEDEQGAATTNTPPENRSPTTVKPEPRAQTKAGGAKQPAGKKREASDDDDI